MSKVETVRGLISQRLSAAAAEIFELFERTIVEYEEQLCRSKEENERQKKLLDAVYSPQLQIHKADVQQLVVSEELLLEQPTGNQGLEQEDSEPPHIKEELEELWSIQEAEQLQDLKEEKPQFPQLHQEQDEENRDSVEGPGPVRNSDPETEQNSGDMAEPETELINAHQQTEAPSGFNFFLKGNNDPCVKLFRCTLCGRQFSQSCNLKRHMRVHTGEKPFSCPFCGKVFALKSSVQKHLKCHTGEKPHSCSLCDKRFARLEHLRSHMRKHTGEKPFSCSSCNERFTWLNQLKRHRCGGIRPQFDELWSRQEGKLLQGLKEEADNRFSTPVSFEK